VSEPVAAYYYVNGQRVPLGRREDLVAVKFRGMDSARGATRGAAGVEAPDFEPPKVENIWPGGEMVLRQTAGVTRSAQERDSRLQALNQRRDIEYASPVFEHSPGNHWIATDQFVVQFQPDVSEFDIDALNDHYHIERMERVAWAPHTHLLRVTPASPGDALSIANVYMESGRAVFAHPNFLRKLMHRMPPLQPDPAQADRHWHLSAIEAFQAWEISSGVSDVVVAVIDDGVDLDHVAFTNQVADHFNAIDRSNNPRPPAAGTNVYRHGTACAGLAIGAPNETIGTSGVAPGCQLMAIRLLERIIPQDLEDRLDETLSDEENVAIWRGLSVVQPYREALAIQWAAEHGADVISNSWGPPDGYAQYGTSYPIDDIARLALTCATEQGRGGKGCVVCWAAGNGNESVSFDGYASHTQVLAVAACTVDEVRAPYSDYGPEVDICAPGGGYQHSLLTTASVDPDDHIAYRYDFNGTSAATPIVAGVAALLLSAYPDLTREEVYNLLCESADKIDPASGNYDSGGHSPLYGYGRVNARRALELAAQRRDG
jgi:subtilisin family serine protease